MKPIPEMPVEEKNQEVAEWLGIHIVTSTPHMQECIGCSLFCATKRSDFTDDHGKVQLLREMMKREDCAWVHDSSSIPEPREVCIFWDNIYFFLVECWK